MENNRNTQVCIIALITVLATMSLVLGLKRGIKWLANIAFALSLFILLSVVFLDEPWYILNANTSAIGYYLWYLPKISFHTDAWEELGSASQGLGGAPDDDGGSAGWMNGWTVFYWGWWISWAPFVGTFLAKISRGRTLRQFIMCTLFVPTVYSVFWFGIYGSEGIRMQRSADGSNLCGMASADIVGNC